MTPMPILVRHGAVGPALWLWDYLSQNTKPTDTEWRLVANGIEITDEQLAYRLDVTSATAKRWRERLERLGYVFSELLRPRHRRMWIANSNPLCREQSMLRAAANGFVN